MYVFPRARAPRAPARRASRFADEYRMTHERNKHERDRAADIHEHGATGDGARQSARVTPRVTMQRSMQHARPRPTARPRGTGRGAYTQLRTYTIYFGLCLTAVGEGVGGGCALDGSYMKCSESITVCCRSAPRASASTAGAAPPPPGPAIVAMTGPPT